MAHPISAMLPGDGSHAGSARLGSDIMNSCKVSLFSSLNVFSHFHIVFFKHNYCTTAVNVSPSAGRLQRHRAERSWHAGSTRKVCEQVGVFVQVCTNNSLSKAENIPVLAAAPSTTPSTPCHSCCLCLATSPVLVPPQLTTTATAVTGSSQHLFGDRVEGTDLSIPPVKGPRVLLEMSR